MGSWGSGSHTTLPIDRFRPNSARRINSGVRNSPELTDLVLAEVDRTRHEPLNPPRMSQLALPFADGTERPPSRALHIHRSNRPESLVDDLSEVLGRPLLDPMAADLIVVQGAGMATYLSVQLAKRRGLLMNVELSYPRRFIESCIDRVLGPTQGGGVSESTLFWALYA